MEPTCFCKTKTWCGSTHRSGIYGTHVDIHNFEKTFLFAFCRSTPQQLNNDLCIGLCLKVITGLCLSPKKPSFIMHRCCQSVMIILGT